MSSADLNKAFDAYSKGQVSGEKVLEIEEELSTDYAKATLEATDWAKRIRMQIADFLGLLLISEKNRTNGRPAITVGNIEKDGKANVKVVYNTDKNPT
jgi:hypothetical protein